MNNNCTTSIRVPSYTKLIAKRDALAEKIISADKYRKLLAKHEALELKISEARVTDLKEMWVQIDHLLSTFKVTKHEFVSYVKLKKQEMPSKVLITRKEPKKVPVKYSDGVNTWSGRGKPTRAFKHHLDQGHSLEEFLVSH